MNIIVLIEGREALPVRAIPIATHWDSMSPDEMAEVLAAPSEPFFSIHDHKAHS